MDAFEYVIIIIGAILNGVLFCKVWGMTNNVKEMKWLQNGMANNTEKMRLKICNRGLTNAQLSKRVLELKYTGKIDEAKKLVDQNLMLDVFNFICDKEASVEQTKEKVGKVVTFYGKYYKILNCEAPDDLKDINVEKVMEDYKTIQ